MEVKSKTLKIFIMKEKKIDFFNIHITDFAISCLFSSHPILYGKLGNIWVREEGKKNRKVARRTESQKRKNWKYTLCIWYTKILTFHFKKITEKNWEHVKHPYLFKHVFFFSESSRSLEKAASMPLFKNVNEITCIITGLSGSHWSWAKYQNSATRLNKELTKVEIINANEQFYEK